MAWGQKRNSGENAHPLVGGQVYVAGSLRLTILPAMKQLVGKNRKTRRLSQFAMNGVNNRYGFTAWCVSRNSVTTPID
jgi:hypothetical protein